MKELIFAMLVALVVVLLVLASRLIYLSIEDMVARRDDDYGYGRCYRCMRTWNHIEGHVTNYESHELDSAAMEQALGEGKIYMASSRRGCFPLCEDCWSALETPDARMPFYRMLWQEWEKSTPGHAKWADIEAAVNASL